MKKRIID